jgi:hypothetical protein
MPRNKVAKSVSSRRVSESLLGPQRDDPRVAQDRTRRHEPELAYLEVIALPPHRYGDRTTVAKLGTFNN